MFPRNSAVWWHLPQSTDWCRCRWEWTQSGPLWGRQRSSPANISRGRGKTSKETLSHFPPSMFCSRWAPISVRVTVTSHHVVWIGLPSSLTSSSIWYSTCSRSGPTSFVARLEVRSSASLRARVVTVRSLSPSTSSHVTSITTANQTT